MINLWPESLSPSERLPYSVLFSQAEFFNRLYFGASAESAGDPTANKSTFIIRDKKSEFVLLEIHHASDYPCKVFFDGKMSQCRTEAELIGELAKIFHSQKCKSMIGDLMK